MTSLRDMLQMSLWARSFTPERLRAVENAIVVTHFPAGGFVCRRGAPVEHWVGVIDGLVKMSRAASSGKTVSLTGISSGGWFGEGSLLKDRTWKYDAIALRQSRIAYMPRATFMSLLDTSIPFNRFLLEQLNERLGQFISLVEIDRLLEPDARVARCIASLFNPYLYPGLGSSLVISQEELAYLCGLSRQRVNQALHLLEGAKLVNVDYGSVTVLNLEGLREFDL
jgi:CRP/FNR family transcriptional regulator, cyclic AMP receptor protein